MPVAITPQGAAIMARLDELARFSAEPDALTRLYLSPEHAAAAQEVLGWMREAGMSAGTDAIGNVVGRYEAIAPGAPALLLGSHIDTVRNAGRYDGNLGVVVAIEAVATLHRNGERLPFAIEVLAFGDEEGVRFPVTLSGSRAVAGTFDPAALEATDEQGVTLRYALAAFGCDPAAIAAIGRQREAVAGYCEVHIEQGPVLEAENLPVGVVTAIAGASRFGFTITGIAGHAGTVPMALRHDALCAAAEMILAIEQAGRETDDLVATVGRIEALPGAPNVIPSSARFTLDIRSPRDAVRESAVRQIRATCDAVAQRRQVGLDIVKTYDEPAAVCDPAMIAQLDAAIVRAGVRPLHLPSGAGHDGLAMIALCPISMLFVRCAGGISHNPAEAMGAADAGFAARVLVDFLRHFEPPRTISPAGDARHE